MFAAPIKGHAYQNKLNVDMSFGSGDLKTPSGTSDVKLGMFGFEYTKFFNDLMTIDGTPYVMREFIQRPSIMTFALHSSDMEITKSGSPKYLESTLGGFTISGMYYFPNGTGFGATISGSSGENKEKSAAAVYSSEDTKSSITILSANHYLNDYTSVGIDIINAKYEFEKNSGSLIEYDEQLIGFHGAILRNNRIWLTGGIKIGNRDIKGGETQDKAGIMLEAGYFPRQKLGVFLTVASDKLEGKNYEETETTSTLALTYNVSDALGLRLGFSRYRIDITSNGTDSMIDVNTLDMGFNMLF
jgi:hypothetical protein